MIANLHVLMEASISLSQFLATSTLESTKLIIKGSGLLAKDIRKAKLEKDPKEAKKLWREALKNAKVLRKKAQEIPKDTITDQVIRAFTDPWWSLVSSYAMTVVSKEKFSDMSKNDTIKKFDLLIRYINHEIDMCNKKLETEE